MLRFYDSSLRVEFILYVACRVKKTFLITLVTITLHPTVCNPIRSTSIRWNAKKWAPLPPLIIGTFFWPHARADFAWLNWYRERNKVHMGMA